MSKFNGYGGGFPGMGGNMNQLLKQAQKMQNDMMKSQEEIEQKEFEVSSGGGAVTIVMNGKKIVKSIKIKPTNKDFKSYLIIFLIKIEKKKNFIFS